MFTEAGTELSKRKHEQASRKIFPAILTYKWNYDRLLKSLGEHGNAELTFYNESYVHVLRTYLEVIVFRLDAQLRR